MRASAIDAVVVQLQRTRCASIAIAARDVVDPAPTIGRRSVIRWCLNSFFIIRSKVFILNYALFWMNKFNLVFTC